MADKRPQKPPLKFTEKNLDVLKILNKQKNYTQYICDAVRFYEEHNISLLTSSVDDYEGHKAPFYEINKRLQNIEDLINSSLKGPVIRTSPLVDEKLRQQIIDEPD